jgi:hypothetical protein
MYDPEESSAVQLFNDLLSNAQEPVSNVEFILDTGEGKEVSGSAILTSVSASVAVGSVTACTINFQISGPTTGGF